MDRQQEIRARLKKILLKSVRKPTENLTSNERKALKQLHEENNLIIRPADKGRCIVVMDKLDYVNKVKSMLSDAETYEVLREDPTKKSRRNEQVAEEMQRTRTPREKLYQLLMCTKGYL